MVGLGYQELGAPDALRHLVGDMAQVGDHRRLFPSGRQGVAGALSGVVGGGEGLHVHPAQGKPLTRGKGVEHLLQEGNAVAQLHPGAPAGIYRHRQLLGHGGQPGDVVGVLMGDQHGGQGLGVHPHGFEGGGDPAAGDACVHQNMGVSAAHQQAVAAGAAGEGTKFQHKIAPSRKKQAGNLPRLRDGI